MNEMMNIKWIDPKWNEMNAKDMSEWHKQWNVVKEWHEWDELTEWMNTWNEMKWNEMNEMNEMNEWMNERKKDWMNEWMKWNQIKINEVK